MHPNSDVQFRLYTSKMNEICLHCHLLDFSSIISSFGQCERAHTYQFSKNQLDFSLESVMRPVCVVNFSLAPFKKTSFKCDENENLIYIKWLAGSC